MNRQSFEAGSFREGTSRVFRTPDGSIYRALKEPALRQWEKLAGTRFYRQFVDNGRLAPTERVDAAQSLLDSLSGQWSAVLRHQVVPFVSYPYEWCFGMLQDAALLQLELQSAALEEGMTLKDGTSFNVQFVGAAPQFIDITSLEALPDGAIWTGYRQFCQLCLYPLLLQAYKDVPFQPWLRGNVAGIDPDVCWRLMSARDMFRSGVFAHVYLQSVLQARYADARRDVRTELKSAGFHRELIQANVKRMIKLVRRLHWRRGNSAWSDYEKTKSYTDEDRRAKEDFVRQAVQTRRWKLVWDVGCNTGVFSRIAAENSDYVAAMDFDPVVIESLYRDLKQSGPRTILPLVVNVVDSSPGLGWRGSERRTLAERGRPELALCLGLIHHLVISENIPLTEVLDWLVDLKTDLVIEFITKADPMVERLLLNKDDIYSDYELEHFERLLAERFDVSLRQPLKSGSRVLYFGRCRDRGFRDRGA